MRLQNTCSVSSLSKEYIASHKNPPMHNLDLLLAQVENESEVIFLLLVVFAILMMFYVSECVSISIIQTEIKPQAEASQKHL